MSKYNEFTSLIAWSGDTFILHIETTGVDLAVDNIIEIGVLKITKNVEKELNMLIKLPDDKKISREITELTGITDNMLADSGIAPEEAAERFRTFVWDF